jgi:hypothetical protein
VLPHLTCRRVRRGDAAVKTLLVAALPAALRVVRCKCPCRHWRRPVKLWRRPVKLSAQMQHHATQSASTGPWTQRECARACVRAHLPRATVDRVRLVQGLGRERVVAALRPDVAALEPATRGVQLLDDVAVALRLSAARDPELLAPAGAVCVTMGRSACRVLRVMSRLVVNSAWQCVVSARATYYDKGTLRIHMGVACRARTHVSLPTSS